MPKPYVHLEEDTYYNGVLVKRCHTERSKPGKYYYYVECPHCHLEFSVARREITHRPQPWRCTKCAEKQRVSTRKHGHTGEGGTSPSPTYRSWQKMRQRCTNPKHPSYPHYGMKGITFCDEWNSFEKFLADMDERPEGETLDRIDNAKGYFKENCRWADRATQNMNRTVTLYVEYKGQRRKLHELCQERGMSTEMVRLRLKSGWDVDAAIETPSDRRNLKLGGKKRQNK